MGIVWRLLVLPVFAVWMVFIFPAFTGVLVWKGVVWVATGDDDMQKTEDRIEWMFGPIDWIMGKARLL